MHVFDKGMHLLTLAFIRIENIEEVYQTYRVYYKVFPKLQLTRRDKYARYTSDSFDHDSSNFASQWKAQLKSEMHNKVGI